MKSYDKRQQEEIYKQQVHPILELAFLPYNPLDPAEPFDTRKRQLFEIRKRLNDFFTTLLICSRLKIPFVFDIDRLTNDLVRTRNDLVRDGSLKNPQILNDLLAILWLYKHQDAWTVVPSGSDKGSILDIWRQLLQSAQYRELSSQVNKLGYARSESFDMQVSKLRDLSQNIANSGAFRGIVSVAKTAVNVFLGPLGHLGSEVVTQLALAVFGKQYVPPIYNLRSIEEAVDRFLYPDKEVDSRYEPSCPFDCVFCNTDFFCDKFDSLHNLSRK